MTLLRKQRAADAHWDQGWGLVGRWPFCTCWSLISDFCELPNWSLWVKPEVILSALILLRPLCCWHPVREESQTQCLSITKHEKRLHLRLWGFSLRARRSGWGRECACEQTFFIRYVKDREKQNNELWRCWNVQSRRTPVYDTGDHILILFFRSEMVRRCFRPAWTTVRYEVYILQDDKKNDNNNLFLPLFTNSLFLFDCF